jgi:uncharacterized protein (DUF58 family)
VTGLFLAALVWAGAGGILLWLRALPTLRLAALIAATAPLWLLSIWSWGAIVSVLATTLVAVVAVIDALSIPARDEFAVQRNLPTGAGLGDEVRGSYSITSRARRPVRLSLHDLAPRGLTLLHDGGRLRQTLPGRPLEIPVTLVGTARGSHVLRPVTLRLRGRWGLVQRTAMYPDTFQIRIAPSLATVRHYRLLALQHRLRELGVRSVRRRGEGTSFSNLREYAVGDDPRRVDWKATARRQKLFVREYTVEQGQTVLIAVDAGRLMTQLSGTVPRFEHALASATVLADVAVHSRDQVGLIVFNDSVRALVPPMRGAAALKAIREAFVGVQATMSEPDYAGAFRTLAARHRKRSLIVLFTDVIDPRASRALIAHASRSAARHLPLVVALRNDRLVEAAIPGGNESTRELYVTAAAEELLLEREEALARMRRSGVSVVDVSPTEMTAAVVNRYLAIKARASL